MSKQKTITVEITGMSCPSCAESVKIALNNMEGVSESVVDFETRKVTVTGSVSRDDIYKVIEGLGYGVAKE
ncbi:MAG: heavy-metal-associated domain-containing protein [Planctomycetota bacterium]|jgi:Cu+-exporting ATPase